MQPGGVYPVRFATNPNFCGLVTLNLIQGPSGRMHGAIRKGTQPAAPCALVRTGWAEKWTLKQVQGDKEFSGASFV